MFDFAAAQRLLNDAFDSIIGNVLAALRISLWPFVAMLIAIAILLSDLLQAIHQASISGVPIDFQGGAGRGFLVVGVVLFTMYLVTVKWHRFVLLPADQGGRDVLPLAVTLVYALVSILVLLCVAIVVVIVMFIPMVAFTDGRVTVGLGAFQDAYARGLAFLVFVFFVNWLFLWLVLSVSPILVSIAIRAEPRGFEALRHSDGRGAELRALALIMTTAMLAWDFLGIGLAGLPGGAQLALVLVINWIAFMMSISILTTFYKLAPEMQGNASADLS